MSSLENVDLVREIADRIDDGRRLDLRRLARDLDVDLADVSDAYRELARRRGHDPLIERARRHLDEARRIGELARAARR